MIVTHCPNCDHRTERIEPMENEAVPITGLRVCPHCEGRDFSPPNKRKRSLEIQESGFEGHKQILGYGK